MFYSKSTTGFYLPEIHGDNIPSDAVEITTEEHTALLEGQSQGKRIVAGEDGHPELADPPPVDPQIAIVAKLAAVRAVREEILNRLGGIAGRADRKGDKATANACDVATQSLLDITKDLPGDDLDSIVLEIVTRYGAIVTTAAAAAPGLVSAFAGVDL
jgi:hypothetical protein